MFGEKGFILKNETLVRFEPVGVTWNDSYCRSITDSGPSGCFIERDSYFENITDFDFQEVFGVLNFDQLGYNNCLEGKVEQDKCNSLRRLCFMKSTSLKKEKFGKCRVFEWKECQRSPLDIIDIDTCPVIEQVEIESNPLRIELDDSLIESFNELSDDELELAFGKFTPVQSLNAYITKLSLCSITQVELSH